MERLRFHRNMKMRRKKECKWIRSFFDEKRGREMKIEFCDKNKKSNCYHGDKNEKYSKKSKLLYKPVSRYRRNAFQKSKQ